MRGSSASPRPVFGGGAALLGITAVMVLAACQLFADGEVRPQLGTRVAGSLPQSWGLPQVDPCSLVSVTEMAELANLDVWGTRPGGQAVDGFACAYHARGPVVIRIGILSTAAYESLKLDIGGEPVVDVAAEAVAQGPNGLGDVALYARTRSSAVQVLVSGVRSDTSRPTRLELAAAVARLALERIESRRG